MKLKNENTDTEFVKRESDAHVSQNTVIATCQLTNSPTGPPQMTWKQLLGLVRCRMFDRPCRARTSRSTVDAFKIFEYARIVTFSECTTPTASSYLKHLWSFCRSAWLRRRFARLIGGQTCSPLLWLVSLIPWRRNFPNSNHRQLISLFLLSFFLNKKKN